MPTIEDRSPIWTQLRQAVYCVATGNPIRAYADFDALDPEIPPFLETSSSESDAFLLALREGRIESKGIPGIGADWPTEHSVLHIEKYAKPGNVMIRIPSQCWRRKYIYPNIDILIIHPSDQTFMKNNDCNIFMDIMKYADNLTDIGMPELKMGFTNIIVNARQLLDIFNKLKLYKLDSGTSPVTEDQMIPAYVSYMLRAARELDISPGKRLPKIYIEHWIKENWPKEFGKISKNKINYMSTFLRDPDHQRGGFIQNHGSEQPDD